MTPFTADTASAAARKGGSRRTPAQRAALQMGRRARRGSGYVPQEPELVRALLSRAAARAGGNRALAALIGSSESAIRGWLAGRSWPRPAVVAKIRGYLAA